MIERAQPWLGTIVSIRVWDMSECQAQFCIEKAFAEIAAIHRCMSFHSAASDVSRLNARAHLEPIPVHPYTFQVIRQAQTLSQKTKGCFDITTGRELVEWDLLPRHESPHFDSGGRWEDIELLPDNYVRFRRPLCIDLGGIAKGFAVDRGIDRLRALGCPGAVINAGGDLRVYGEREERIALRLEQTGSNAEAPILELSEGSLASSSGHLNRRMRGTLLHSSHVDGRRRVPARTDRFVSVISRDCVIADALTKVVMAAGKSSAAVLRHFDAVAYLHDPQVGWRSFGSSSS